MPNPPVRLTDPQARVLRAIAVRGYTSLALIADSAELPHGVAQRTLDALTRHNLVTPVAYGYLATARAKRTLAAQ